MIPKRPGTKKAGTKRLDKGLLNSRNEDNAINPAFTWKLGFHIQKTNIGAQKIDNSILKTFGIVITDLKIENKASKSRFFQKTFLAAETKLEVILEMLFLKINNADVSFSKKTLM